MIKFFIALVLLFILLFGAVSAMAGSINRGEGFYTNCPGPIITMLNEEGGVDVYCVLWKNHCDQPVQIWDDGTEFIRVLCDNGKPTPEPPGGPPPQFMP